MYLRTAYVFFDMEAFITALSSIMAFCIAVESC